MSERMRTPSIRTKITPKTRRVELQHKLEKVPNIKKSLLSTSSKRKTYIPLHYL